eukprot:g2671.t1
MPRFIAEVGSLHGHSAIQMATVLDQLGMTQVPILCIDPFTGDTNMKIIDGRMTVFDQFMANVQFAVNRSVSKHHILPFQATSTVGARWIFLDSAHELDETFLELSLYFKLLKPGGILFGDDYGWPADVERFVEEHQRQHGADDPIDLRIVRAQAGATNLIWIMRKAKREPRELDEKNAADRWGRVGTAFACFSIHECWKLVEGGITLCHGSATALSDRPRAWSMQEWHALSQARRRGCSLAEVMRLLEDNWMEAGREEEEALLTAASGAMEEQQRKGMGHRSGELLRKARDAAAAAKASEQWNVLLAVQHLIGRPPNESAPAYKDMQQELHRRRERVMLQARTFMLITSLLEGDVHPPSAADLEARCLQELRRARRECTGLVVRRSPVHGHIKGQICIRE